MTTSIARSLSRRLACAIVVAVTAAGLPAFAPAASAADMPAQARPHAVVVTPLWTGFYFGVHGGGGWASTHVSDPSLQVMSQIAVIDASGPLAGGQIGANWQFGNVVVGGEIDVSWARIRGSRSPEPGFPFSGFETNFRALATGTGRVGYAAGSWLGYAKAGIAWADLEFTYRVGAPPSSSVPHTRTGVTAGAGVEVAFWRNLSAKVEYNFVYFGENSIPIGSNRDSGNADHVLHLVKAGLNMRFGGDYVVARY
ncbi:MAG: outer membrane beta-barrel protein [Xanthobacteraceae bacterium]|nr:outer membrane beta-barrel protein [Xanthobacteraceae bacterium]